MLRCVHEDWICWQWVTWGGLSEYLICLIGGWNKWVAMSIFFMHDETTPHWKIGMIAKYHFQTCPFKNSVAACCGVSSYSSMVVPLPCQQHHTLFWLVLFSRLLIDRFLHCCRTIIVFNRSKHFRWLSFGSSLSVCDINTVIREPAKRRH